MVRERKYSHMLQVRVSERLQRQLERIAEKSGLAVAPAARLCLSAGLFSLEKKLPVINGDEADDVTE